MHFEPMNTFRKSLSLLLATLFLALLAGCSSMDGTDANGVSTQPWDQKQPWEGGIPGMDSMPGANGNSNAYGH
jgi:hypothetical protein